VGFCYKALDRPEEALPWFKRAITAGEKARADSSDVGESLWISSRMSA
jgi:hypothetical protein